MTSAPERCAGVLPAAVHYVAAPLAVEPLPGVPPAVGHCAELPFAGVVFAGALPAAVHCFAVPLAVGPLPGVQPAVGRYAELPFAGASFVVALPVLAHCVALRRAGARLFEAQPSAVCCVVAPLAEVQLFEGLTAAMNCAVWLPPEALSAAKRFAALLVQAWRLVAPLLSGAHCGFAGLRFVGRSFACPRSERPAAVHELLWRPHYLKRVL